MNKVLFNIKLYLTFITFTFLYQIFSLNKKKLLMGISTFLLLSYYLKKNFNILNDFNLFEKDVLNFKYYKKPDIKNIKNYENNKYLNFFEKVFKKNFLNPFKKIVEIIKIKKNLKIYIFDVKTFFGLKNEEIKDHVFNNKNEKIENKIPKIVKDEYSSFINILSDYFIVLTDVIEKEEKIVANSTFFKNEEKKEIYLEEIASTCIKKGYGRIFFSFLILKSSFIDKNIE